MLKSAFETGVLTCLDGQASDLMNSVYALQLRLHLRALAGRQRTSRVETAA